MFQKIMMMVLVFDVLNPVFASSEEGGYRWWKGNTHTHTLWSDGDSPPETVSLWYKEHGYQFLVLSDHNVMLEGSRWYLLRNDIHQKALEKYRRQFGDDWVDTRETDKGLEVRLKPLSEFRTLFEEAGKFIFIPGEEITGSFQKRPVHLNGINLVETILPREGASAAETIQNSIDDVMEQSRKSNQPILIHLNHPNFEWGILPEDILEVTGDAFFEIFNGGPDVENYGDEARVGTERMWDIVLAKRLGELGLPVFYGVASDDAHFYVNWGIGQVNPGRGWVMVRAKRLTPESIVNAMKMGDYYCSTGVLLDDIHWDGKSIHLAVKPEPNVNYTIEFIGTKKGTDLVGVPIEGDDRAKGRYNYSEAIGTVFEKVTGPEAWYQVKGDELYIRARITSDRYHPNPFAKGDVEMAWTQPFVPSK